MMLRYLGWMEAADLVIKGLERAINAKVVTYDFARLMSGATKVSTTGFADRLVENLESRQERAIKSRQERAT